MSQTDDDSNAGQESTRSISEGETSRSGVSDEIAVKPSQRRQSARPLSDGSVIAAAVPKCTMCDSQRSEYICPQCGRLSFCLKCCVSLHDNKFLGTHKLVSLDAISEGTEHSVAALKEQLNQSKTAPAGNRNVGSDSQKPSTAAHEKEKGELWKRVVQPASDESLDLAGIAADRNVVQARLREMSSCREWLDRLHADLNSERLSCKEATHTACEAVRRKFDVLRNVLSAKEAEYLAVVEAAGKKRLDLATQVCCSSGLAIGEVEAFIAQMSNQLARLEMNNDKFNSARRSMLEETQRRLHGIDDTIHALQSSLDDIRSVSLGVHIVLEDAVAAINSMTPPVSLSSRLHDMPHVMPVSTSKFMSTPGITVVRQAGEIERSMPRAVQPSSPISAKVDAEPVAPIRKSFAQELQSLQQTPLETLRQNSPGRFASSQIPAIRSLQPPQEPSTANLMARIAAKANRFGSSASAAPSRGASPLRQKSTVVPELERLRQQIHATSSFTQQASHVDTPMGRGRSPTARPSPYRRGSPAPLAPAGVQRGADSTPGPGAYFKAQDFNQRSVLSTPPRRRT